MLLLLLTAELTSPAEPSLLDSYISRIAVGDTDALGLLYNSTKSSVYAYALSILRSSQDAEDVLHDCYIALNSAAKGYTSCGKPMAWIITITKNLCLKRLREREMLSDTPAEDFLSRIGDTQGLSADEKLILEECLNTLSDEERQIVVLHAVSGFRHREIAHFMELPLSTVLSKYSRAISKLRKKL